LHPPGSPEAEALRREYEAEREARLAAEEPAFRQAQEGKRQEIVVSTRSQGITILSVVVLVGLFALAFWKSCADRSVPPTTRALPDAPTAGELEAKRLQTERLDMIQAKTRREADALFSRLRDEAAQRKAKEAGTRDP
jgi:hypothetical protein